MKEKLRKVGKRKNRRALKISIFVSFVFTAGLLSVVVPHLLNKENNISKVELNKDKKQAQFVLINE